MKRTIPAKRPVRTPADVREQLLRVGLHHFRQKGFGAAPVSEITREAGVAKGTFFNHFPSKDHLLAEAFHRMVSEATEEAEKRGEAGPTAILSFAQKLGDALAKDRTLARSIIPHIGALPAIREGEPREEERIRSWLQRRLGEALPLRVPLVEIPHPILAEQLSLAIRGVLEVWDREESTPRALQRRLRERVTLLLRVVGLPEG